MTMDDYDKTPVKNSINNDIYLTLHRSISSNYYYKISENKVSMKDSITAEIKEGTEFKF